MTAVWLLLAAQDDGGPLRLVHRDGRVEIFRDEWGVPHVYAPTWRAALWGHGYAQAQDRLWQMEEMRRAARSSSAELRGRVGLADDIGRLQTGYTEEEMQAILDGCSERFRTALREYADGVNTFLREEDWPAEYRRFRSEPMPWQPLDSAAIAVAMARRLGESGNEEFDLTRLHGYLRATLGDEAAEDIFADLFGDDPAAPTTMGDAAAAPPPEGLRPSGVTISDEAYAAWHRNDGARDPFPAHSGSNAWAIAPSRAASGRAMLFGAPMMGFGTPSIAYEAHIVCPEFDAYGMSFPGIPGVMIGFTRRHAWTTTTGNADIVDIYELTLNPDNPDQYRHNDEWRDFEAIEVPIRVRRQEDESTTIVRSIHGPVTVIDPTRLRAYATRYSFWRDEIRTIEAFLDFSFAASMDEFADAVSRVTTSHNVLYADADGRIAFWYAGRHPRRRAEHDPRFVQPGDGTREWSGFLSFAETPQDADPYRGYFANWNNRPTRSWMPWYGGRVFPGRPMLDYIDAHPRMTLDECWAGAREATERSWTRAYYGESLLRLIEGGGRDLDHAAALIRAWDGRDSADSTAAFLMAEWSGSMMGYAFRGAVGPLAFGGGAQRHLATPLLNLLEGREMRHDYLGDHAVREIARTAMERIFTQAREALGEDETAWRREMVVRFGDAGETPSPLLRGTYTLVVEFGDPPRALSLLPPGQTEDPESPHYRDQLPLFEAWGGRRAILDRSELER